MKVIRWVMKKPSVHDELFLQIVDLGADSRVPKGTIGGRPHLHNFQTHRGGNLSQIAQVVIRGTTTTPQSHSIRVNE